GQCRRRAAGGVLEHRGLARLRCAGRSRPNCDRRARLVLLAVDCRAITRRWCAPAWGPWPPRPRSPHALWPGALRVGRVDGCTAPTTFAEHAVTLACTA